MESTPIQDRHIRSDLFLMLIIVLAFGISLTALRMYDNKSGFVKKFSEKYIERFIKL